MKKKIKITVEGEPNSGKSTIRMLIVDCLREKGLDVIVAPTIDHPTEGDARAIYSPNKLSKWDMMVERVDNVTVHEEFTKRDES